MILIGPTLGAVGVALAFWSGSVPVIAFCVAIFVVNLVITADTLRRS